MAKSRYGSVEAIISSADPKYSKPLKLPFPKPPLLPDGVEWEDEYQWADEHDWLDGDGILWDGETPWIGTAEWHN